MSKKAIPTNTVTCTDGSTDTYIGINPNTNTDDKVQAFVDCFKSAASIASSICYNLPVKLILAQWGGECGWATGSTQKSNQNFSNLGYNSATNPVGNIGQGKNGWAKFEGRGKHTQGYAYWFINNSRYSSLITYLEYCKRTYASPDASVCASTIANAGFGGSDHDAYYQNLVSWMNTLTNHATL